MKKLSFLVAASFLLFAQGANAQGNMFNHLGLGVSAGTDGIGLELSAPCTDYLQIRAGYSFLPKIKVKPTIDFDSSEDFLRRNDGSGGYYDEVKVEGKLNMGDFKLLLDVYPSKRGSFHFTAGAYFGKRELLQAQSLSEFLNRNYWGTSGPELGSPTNTYTIVSNLDGSVNADLKVKSFKPYLGIGFGRAVPKGRVGVQFDMGVQFWGKPELWTNISDNAGVEYRKIEKDRIVSKESWCEDFADAIDIMEKIIVYPVIKLRITGRIF